MTETAPDRSRHPNILLITCDTLRRDALGCAGRSPGIHPGGASRPVVKTPNIDDLAEHGVFFRNAYTPSPLCQPARAALISGLYPHQNGVIANRSAPLSDELRKRTWARVLQCAGYATAFIGRHHFYDYWDEPGFDYRTLHEEIRRFGFDHVVQINDRSEHGRPLDCDYTAYLQEKGLLEAYRADLGKRGTVPFTAIAEEDNHDAYAARRTLEYLGRQTPGRPFALWLSFGGPHPPYRSIGEFGTMYRPEDMPRPYDNEDAQECARVQREYAQYYGMITQIDTWIGRIVAQLREQRVLDDTLIIFTSDHGDMLGDHGLHHKRRFYEQSVGVPLIVAGPGVDAGPSTNMALTRNTPILVETIDIYPTIVEAAGLRAEGVPGRSLFSAIDHRQQWRRAVFSELGTWSMVRTAQWKLTYDPEQGGVQQLFNLNTDPREMENLAGRPEYAAVEAQLVRELLDWYVRTTTRTGPVERQLLQTVAVGW